MATASASDNAIEGPARWSLRLFGGFELNALPGGERVALPGKRERVLLAYLALSPKSSQQRRKLATLLWGDASDETALDNLRTCVWALRKALGDTGHRAIASEGEDIVLDAAAFDIDALAFRRLAAQSGRTELEEAANLYSGELLDGLGIENDEFESWRRAETTRYRDQAIDVLTRLMTRLSENGETEAAIAAGTGILQLDPLHEPAVRRLMWLYGESGRRRAAIQLYRALADALKTELDVQPEAETRAIFAEVSRSEEDLPSAVAASAAPPAVDAKSLAVSTVTAVPRDAPREPQRLQTRTPFRLRAALAGLAGVLIVAIALISYRQFAQPPASAPQASAISIAVLPFANLSGDTSQEFFSDGMTEEISSALANIQSLRVIGRTSASQFKGQNKDLRAIGQALGAGYLIEGSVRKAGDRVRIAAQLVKADDGVQLWSQNYDRQLTDIFATQEDIAQAIAGALRVPLGLQQGDSLVRNRTGDVESYDQYLQAKALYRARDLPAAIKVLEPVVARDPGFAPAWGLLAQVYVVAPNFSFEARSGSLEERRLAVQTAQDKAEMAAREAIRLDSRNAVGYAVLARVQVFYHSKWAAGDDLYKQALALDPNESDVLLNYSVTLETEGRLKDALNAIARLRRVEPFVPIFNLVAARILHLNGQRQAAIAMFEAIPSVAGGGYFRNLWLAQAYAAAARYGEAADALLLMPGSQVDRRSVEDAARLLRNAPEKVTAPQALPALDRELSFVYAYVGAPDRMMENFEHLTEIRSGFDEMAWLPEFAPLRKTDRFKAVVRTNGLVDYWRARGWPDLCRPVGADDFACD